MYRASCENSLLYNSASHEFNAQRLWSERTALYASSFSHTSDEKVNHMGMRFTKMHGLGNDFIVMDTITQSITLDKLSISALADRHTGIGFDQCLLIEPGLKEGIDFQYRIFNSDGQEVGQCGNGARCLALYLKHYRLTSKKTVRVATSSTEMTLILHDDDTVSVDMGKPLFQPRQIPLRMDEQKNAYGFETADHEKIQFHAVNVGNPHAVIKVDDIHLAAVGSLGATLSKHALFPEQVNVGFMQIVSPDHIRLRVYERGCGETQACGSGAVAAAVIGRLFYGLNDPVTVSLPGGDLTVSWPHPTDAVFLKGPATLVFEGRLIS